MLKILGTRRTSNVKCVFGFLFFLFIINCWVAFVFMLPVRAEGQGLVISPPFQEVSISKTGDKNVNLTITNRTQNSQTLRLSSVDFKSLNESGGVAFLGAQANDLERKYGLANWMNLDTDKVILQPGQSQTVTATIKNLPTLSPGGHYGAVLFRVDAGAEAKNQNKVAIEQQLGSLIFLKKIGGERYGLEIEKIEKPKDWRSASRVVNLMFKNTGNVHVVPRGTVELLSSSGKQIAKSNINPESGILLPESIRKYPVKLSGGILKPGRYTLQVAYRYDGMHKAEIYRETIYVFDAWFAAALGVVCLAVVSMVFFAIRWIWMRKKHKR